MKDHIEFTITFHIFQRFSLQFFDHFQALWTECSSHMCYSRSQLLNSTVSEQFVWCCVVLCGVVWCGMVSCLVLSCLIFSCLALSCLVLSYLILPYPAVCCLVLCFPKLFCRVLSSCVLLCSVLSCAVMCCIVFYPMESYTPISRGDSLCILFCDYALFYTFRSFYFSLLHHPQSSSISSSSLSF